MKLLICCNSTAQIGDFLEWLTTMSERQNTKVYHTQLHEITILETGFGGFQVGYHVATQLGLGVYHLVLKAGYANALRDDIICGDVVNIINDKPADTGMFIADKFFDLYDLEMVKITERPHQMGGYVNKTNSYLNVFSPFRKVLSLSVNTTSENGWLRNVRIKKYQPHIETTDGIYFAYACLWRQQPFYHLASVQQNLLTDEKNSEIAFQNLNKALINIIQKL